MHFSSDEEANTCVSRDSGSLCMYNSNMDSSQLNKGHWPSLGFLD